MQNPEKMAFRYRLVDIGVNLTHHKFKKDVVSVISRAVETGVEKMIVTGTSEAGSTKAKQLAEKHPGVLYFTAGVHPHSAKEWDETTEESLASLVSHPQCVAVGECGLDFNRNFSTPDQQIHAFKQQILLAIKTGKPMFCHERDAFVKMVELFTPYLSQLPPVVIHCFTGKLEQAEKYLQMGFLIGLTGYLWKDKSADGVRHMLQTGKLPLDRLLLETDGPFMFPNIQAKKHPASVIESLTPESCDILRKYSNFQRTEPSAMCVINELVAAYMGKEPKVVADSTFQNAKTFFNLK